MIFTAFSCLYKIPTTATLSIIIHTNTCTFHPCAWQIQIFLLPLQTKSKSIPLLCNLFVILHIYSSACSSFPVATPLVGTRHMLLSLLLIVLIKTSMFSTMIPQRFSKPFTRSITPSVVSSHTTNSAKLTTTWGAISVLLTRSLKPQSIISQPTARRYAILFIAGVSIPAWRI